MHLIQLFLPLRDDTGQRFGRANFDRVREELTEQFGGVTAFVRSPAAGAWEDDDGDVQRDEMILIEVMVETLDRGWWQSYREEVRERFRQDELLVRATAVQVL